MFFDQKLNALMHLFKLSNSKLARGINVDPSLISRWKSGERQMSTTSPHVPAIASYFLRLNTYHYQRDYLDQILKQKLGQGEQVSEAKRIHALAEWLISHEPLALPEMSGNREQSTRSADIIQGLAGLVSGSVQNSAVSAAAMPLPSMAAIESAAGQPGNRQQHEIFEGHQGLRQAALKLMYQVIHSILPLEMLLTSEDDITWLIEDPVFLKQWAYLLRLILQQGHRITVIHVVNRKQSEILSALAQWTPLHLAGNIQSFYHPGYSEQDVRRTLFLIKDQAAVVGYHTGSQDPADLTFYYTDIQTVRHYTRVFNTFLSNCRPLFSVFSQRNLRSFLDQLLELRMQAGTVYNIRQHFNAMILTPDLIQQILPSSPMVSVSNRQLLSAIRMQVDTFFASLTKNRTVDILPFSIIEQIRRTKALPLTSASFFNQDAAYLRGEQMLLYLQNLIAVLKAEDNYELYFSPGVTELETLRTNIMLKEGKAAVFSSPAFDQPNPLTIMINESNILQTLSIFFDDFIGQIPSHLCSKPDVIHLLESLVYELKAKPAR